MDLKEYLASEQALQHVRQLLALPKDEDFQTVDVDPTVQWEVMEDGGWTHRVGLSWNGGDEAVSCWIKADDAEKGTWLVSDLGASLLAARVLSGDVRFGYDYSLSAGYERDREGRIWPCVERDGIRIDHDDGLTAVLIRSVAGDFSPTDLPTSICVVLLAALMLRDLGSGKV